MTMGIKWHFKIGSALLGLLGLCSPALPFGGGTGASGDPYIIQNVDDLQAMQSGLSAHYRLEGEIDASATASWNGGQGFVPVGTYAAPFSGSLDGDEYAIDALTINRPSTEAVGLFGALAPGSSVQNVLLSDVSVTGGTWLCGSLVGFCNGTITNCGATGTVSAAAGSTTVIQGGLVAMLDQASISQCYFDGTVELTAGSAWQGGLIGHLLNSPVTWCRTSGMVLSNGASKQAGGLIGQGSTRYGVNTTFTVENCFSTCTISGTAQGYGGGLVGNSDRWMILKRCWSTGSVYGTSFVGGLIGALGGHMEDCYTTGTAWSDSNLAQIGGLTGSVAIYIGTVERCYAAGTVTAGASPTRPPGGLVCYCNDTAQVSGSFWDTEATGLSSSAAGTGLTTAQMKTSTPFLGAGWELTGNESEPTTWLQLPGSYPILPSAQPVALSNAVIVAGAGEATVGDLKVIGPQVATMYFTLVSGPGDTNNDLFEIAGGQLRVVNPAALTPGDYQVRVRGQLPAKESTRRIISSFEAPLAIRVVRSNAAGDLWNRY